MGILDRVINEVENAVEGAVEDGVRGERQQEREEDSEIIRIRSGRSTINVPKEKPLSVTVQESSIILRSEEGVYAIPTSGRESIRVGETDIAIAGLDADTIRQAVETALNDQGATLQQTTPEVQQPQSNREQPSGLQAALQNLNLSQIGAPESVSQIDSPLQGVHKIEKAGILEVS